LKFLNPESHPDSILEVALLLTYLAVVILCIIKGSELIDNPNRAGMVLLQFICNILTRVAQAS